MINRPELGRHVLTFQAADRFPFLSPSNITRVLRHWRGGPAFWITRPMTYRSMAERTIQHLVNVKALSFHGTTPASIGRLAGHHSITKVRLVHPTLMTELESLLDALPLVTHLTLPFNTVGPPEAGAIHTDHVPNLESLICSTDAVGLVAGRPIRELYIMFPMRWDPPPSVHTIMEKVSQSTVPLRVLGIAIEWIWTFGEDYSEVLTAAARVLPDLEELHLAFGFFPGQAQFVQNIFEVLPQTLESFKCLHTLTWTGSSGSDADWFTPHPNTSSETFIPVLESWSRGCPSLHKVVFPNNSIWESSEASGEWQYSGIQPKVKPGTGKSWGGMTPMQYWNGAPTWERDLSRDWPKSKRLPAEDA